MNIVNVGYDSTNYYVLEQKQGAKSARLLIDVGFPGTLPKLLAILKRVDIALPSIDYLLATHYHPDHAGLAQEVKAQGVRLIVMEPQLAAIPLLTNYMKPTYPYVPITLHDNLQLAIDESRAFLKELGIDGEIISTPGHSDDSVSLILDKGVLGEGVAFTGDMPCPLFGDDSPNHPASSGWARLRALGVTRIYPGHGPQQPFLPPT